LEQLTMTHKRPRGRRRGATLVEFALVLPVLLLLLLGTIIGALGVFRYQQVASMAREAARYAVVHGGQYSQEQTKALTTAQNIFDNVIKGRAVGFDLSDVGVGNDFNNPPTNKFILVVQYDNPNEMPVYPITNNGTGQINRVKVLIKYNWQPEAYWGIIPLQSTSETLMAY
jgi:Flp pilus assembly protein TadG